jgi:hypothetical protein
MATTTSARGQRADNNGQRTKDDPHRRSPAYAALAAGYTGLIGAFVVAARRTGRRPPRLGAGDIALMGIATFKVSRVLSRDRVTSWLRAPFTDFERRGEGNEVIDKPKGAGMQRAVGELMSCPFCLSQWIGTVFAGGFVLAPGVTRLAASGLVAITISDVLQYAHTALQQSTD